ncbi:MAG TPA: PAS domain S-box protein [Bacteroidota bacterium]|nr:PAS domain S-box protein [Bacteroidota bacterium]
MKNKKFTILLVDDHTVSLQLHSHILKKEGYEVEEAMTGNECLQAITKIHPDLVLLDVILPDIHGMEICHRIKTDPATKDILVMMISGIEIEHKAQLKGLRAGADGYLVKPVSKPMLLAHVHVMERIKRTENELRDANMMLEKRVQQRTKKLKQLNKKLIKEIVERKEVEAVLQHKEEHYRTLFQNNPIPLFVYDCQTLAFLAANDAALLQYGYSEQEFLSMSLLDIHPSEEKATVQQTVTLGDGRLRKPGPFHHQKNDGTIINVELVTHDLIFEKRQARLVMAIDITERVRAERDLRRATEEAHAIFWRAIVTQAEDETQGSFGYYWDSHFANLDVVSNYLDLPDYPTHALVDRFYFSWLEEDRNRTAAQSAEAIRKGLDGYTEEFRLRDAAGNIHWMYNEAHIHRVHEKIYELTGIILDNTERKQAEETLRQSEERFRKLIEGAPAAVVILSTSGKILYTNPTSLMIFGVKNADEILGKDIMEYIAPEQHGSMLKRYHLLSTGNQVPSQFESVGVRADGTLIPLHIAAANLQLQGEEVSLHFITDITERKRTEEDLRRATEGAHAIFWHSLVTNSEDETQGSYGYIWETRYANLDVAHEFLDLPDYPSHTFSDRYYYSWLEEDREAMNRQSTEALRHGLAGYTQEFRLMDAKGKIHWMYLEAHITRLNEKAFDVAGITMEITERKRAEEDLRLATEGAHAIFWYASVTDTQDVEQGAYGYLWDTHYANLDVVQEFIDLPDYPTHNLRDRFYYCRLEEDRKRMDRQGADALRTGLNRYTQEFRLMDAKGKIHWMYNDAHVKRLNEKSFEVAGITIEITERKQAEEDLRLATEDAHAIFWHSTVMDTQDAAQGSYGYLWNTHYANLDAVHEFIDLPEYPTHDLTDRFYFSWLEEDRAKMAPQSAQALRNGLDGYKEEFRLMDAKGNIHWMYNDAHIRKVNERTFEISGIMLDITDRKHAEEAFRASEIKYREMVEQINDVIFVTDVQGQITYMSPAIEVVGGYSPEEMIGHSLSEYLDPAFIPKIQQHYSMVFSGELSPIEYRVKTKSGVWRWARTSSRPILEHGRPVGMRSVLTDITVRKQAEESLNLLSHTVKSITECVCVTDLHGAILFINQAFLDTYGYTEEEVIGKQIEGIVLPQGIDEKKMMSDMVNGGWQGEVISRKRDGTEIPVHLSTSVVSDEEGKDLAFVAVASDITEQKKMQQELIQAQKMQSMGTLAGGIAHDFNNILGIILGHVMLLEKHLANDPRHHSNLHAIQRAGERGAALVRQILTFARKTNTLFEPVDLGELSEEITSMLRQTFPKTISITNNIREELASIFGDRSQIHQVLLNLCVNARDAMPNGGSITLSAELCTKAHVQKQFPRADQPQYVCISVVDTGEGMDDVTRLRAFDPFFTTKPQGKGTGLGLSVVFGVVEAHHGFINLSSEVGKGTTFHIYFPATVTIDQPIETISTNETAGANCSETILVVEDEALLLDMICSVLESNGYRVLRAEDGIKALEVYQSHMDEIQLVITDMGLPGITGEEEFRKLKELNPQVKVILASGFLEPNLQSALREAGALGFLQKPYMPQDVLKLLRGILDQ